MEFSKVRRFTFTQTASVALLSNLKTVRNMGTCSIGILTVNSWVWHVSKKDIMMKFHRLGTPTANRSFSVFADGLQQGDESILSERKEKIGWQI